jgi:diguanylate cyclase (GGDEF)-like protein
VYLLDDEHPGPRCRHWNDAAPGASLCMPLMARGQALGLLHLRAPDENRARVLDVSTEQLAQVVADSVALTWANLTLRETLRQQAIRDPLTNLYNRRFMEESLVRELHRAARSHQSVSLIMMDIDHFKQVNDRFGHAIGDEVLRQLGRHVQDSSRGSDIPCRYGGEEFLLIMPEATLEIAGRRAEQIRERFRQMKFGLESGALGQVTMSLGVAAFPQHGEVMEAVLRAVDAALYRAKTEGRDRTSVAG